MKNLTRDLFGACFFDVFDENCFFSLIVFRLFSYEVFLSGKDSFLKTDVSAKCAQGQIILILLDALLMAAKEGI